MSAFGNTTFFGLILSNSPLGTVGGRACCLVSSAPAIG